MAAGLDVIFILCAAFLFLLGFIGCFLPVLPGPPLAWGGILLGWLTSCSVISTKALIVSGVIALAVTVIDNVAPAWLTKKAGGSKAAIVGSTIGLLVGIFVNPIFVIVGPFLGALIGELLFTERGTGNAFKAAFGAFGGFLLGTGLKIITVAVFVWLFMQGISNPFEPVKISGEDAVALLTLTQQQYL